MHNEHTNNSGGRALEREVSRDERAVREAVRQRFTQQALGATLKMTLRLDERGGAQKFSQSNDKSVRKVPNKVKKRITSERRTENTSIFSPLPALVASELIDARRGKADLLVTCKDFGITALGSIPQICDQLRDYNHRVQEEAKLQQGRIPEHATSPRQGEKRRHSQRENSRHGGAPNELVTLRQQAKDRKIGGNKLANKTKEKLDKKRQRSRKRPRMVSPSATVVTPHSGQRHRNTEVQKKKSHRKFGSRLKT